jgi:hypothetical protein
VVHGDVDAAAVIAKPGEHALPPRAGINRSNGAHAGFTSVLQ